MTCVEKKLCQKSLIGLEINRYCLGNNTDLVLDVTPCIIGTYGHSLSYVCLLMLNIKRRVRSVIQSCNGLKAKRIHTHQSCHIIGTKHHPN